MNGIVVGCLIGTVAGHNCPTMQKITSFELAIAQSLVRFPNGIAVFSSRCHA
jgi:hypothetical protein